MIKKTKQYDFINKRNTFFSDSDLGISVNITLLLFYMYKFLPQHKLKSPDLTVGLLALMHLEMLILWDS